MTAQELIEMLSELDPETEVRVQYPYGDYLGTSIAGKIIDGEFQKIKYSDYHSNFKIIDDDDDDDYDDDYDDDDEVRRVFVLDLN